MEPVAWKSSNVFVLMKEFHVSRKHPGVENQSAARVTFTL